MQTLRRAAAVLICPLIAWLGAGCDRSAPAAPHSAVGPRADLVTTADQVTDWLARALQLGELLSDDPRMTAWTDEAEDDDHDPITVVPFEFDPFGTHLVRARWLRGTGCPTDATAAIDDPLTPQYDPKPTPYTDPACMPGGDPKDKRNEGLLLVKTGPTANFAAAGADLKGVKGITLTELGYDIRTGTHCGAGAPRFNVGIQGDPSLRFIGCASPPPVIAPVSPAWQRLRWNGPCIPAYDQNTGLPKPICPTDVVRSISIIFDEGQDTPFESGLAFLDNIDINGHLIGHGPGN